MSSVSRNELFEAAFRGARRSQEEYVITNLVCSEYKIDKNKNIRAELPVAVLGGFAINGKLVSKEVVRSTGLTEYGEEPGEIEAMAGTHLDKALVEVNSYTGGYSKEFWQQNLTAAGVNCIYEEEPSEEARLVAGVMTFYKPIENRFRSIFAYDRKFDETQFFVKSKATELEMGETRLNLNPIHALAKIEAPESKVLLARAAASCCIQACGCGGLDMPSAPREHPDDLRN